MNIYLLGFMGCGKSYWARMLSREVNMPAFDIDSIIEDLASESLYDLFYSRGEDYFRQVEHQIVEDLTRMNKGYLIACGGGTPCFYNNMALMNETGATIYLHASVDFLYERLLKGRHSRPLIAMYDNVELKEFIKRTLQQREPYYMQATSVIDIERVTMPIFVQTIAQCLNKD